MKLIHPDKVAARAIRYLRALEYVLNAEAIVLSDYREGDPKEHGKGNAIDTTWIDVDPLKVVEVTLDLNLWGGFGLYINEGGYVSFHHDIRPHKANGSIATWYGQITNPGGKKHIEYLAFHLGIDRIKAK